MTVDILQCHVVIGIKSDENFQIRYNHCLHTTEDVYSIIMMSTNNTTCDSSTAEWKWQGEVKV